LRLSWNVWDGGLTRNRTREKRIEWEKSRTDLADLGRAVRLEVRQAYLDMQHAEQAVQAGLDTVKLAGEALAIASSRYEAGLANRLEYTESHLAHNRAKLSWYRALRDHLVAVNRLDCACGKGGVRGNEKQ